MAQGIALWFRVLHYGVGYYIMVQGSALRFRVVHCGSGYCIMVPGLNTSPLLVLPGEFYVVPTKPGKFYVVPTEHGNPCKPCSKHCWLQSMPPAALGTMV